MSWPLVKLQDLVDINIGRTPSRDNPEYWGEGVSWLSIRDMNQGKLLSKTAEQITEFAVKETKCKIAKKGTVLFSFKLSIGKVGFAEIDMFHNEAIAAMPIKKDVELCEEYLYFALLQMDSGKSTDRAVMGATLNKKKMAELEIPLPPLETQKQIAAVLEKADQLRKDCRQMEQELNSLAQSVFIEMFGDPLINPKGWRVRTLNEFYASAKTGTKCGPFGSALKKDEFVDSGVPVWNMSNISLTGEFIDSPSLWITEKKYQNLEAYNVLQGDVIISRAGTVGKMGVVLSKYDRSIISTNLIRVRFGEDLLPLYFVCLMTYCKTRLKRLKVGDDGSFSHMNTGILDNLEFPYPPMNEQLKYMKFREELDAQINCLKQLKIEQELNFSSLMQKAFNGELNLDNANT
ncbi:restriction endonuclease subunit S [Shewanella metallivivens]|uniref:Restriction endonuclease subunit S n=1 Tax=Shewanella metallivivens TaxID=2872342 RepID=A0ABT5TQX4_9GAMM|nr:restriction endonuclease subunit S [Shewanella metallivivens]